MRQDSCQVLIMQLAGLSIPAALGVQQALAIRPCLQQMLTWHACNREGLLSSMDCCMGTLASVLAARPCWIWIWTPKWHPNKQDDPNKVPSPTAHAALHAPMTQGLKKRRGAPARKPSAAAGQSPMTNDMKKKKKGAKGGRAALASLESLAAEHRGRGRVSSGRTTWRMLLL